MIRNLIPISDDKFKSIVKIRFNNIMDGFDNFINFTLTPLYIENAEDSLIKTIEYIFNENGNECYIDLYISKLSEKDKESLLTLLSEDDKKIFKELQMNITHQGVYFKLISKELIPFLTRLNTREAFFVTFYFTIKPITIWGNYDMKFPCFFESNTEKEYYLNLFKNNKLI